MRDPQFPRITWSDPLCLDAQLTEAERHTRASVANFARDALQPLVRELFRSETTPRQLFREFGRLGLLSTTAEGFGCAGLSHVCSGLAAFELERVDSAFHTMVSAQSNLVMHALFRFAPEALKAQCLPALAAGTAVGAFCLTEPDHGSDPSRMRCSARAVDGGFRLRGSKTWITNAPIADLFIVWARTEAPGQVRGFVVERAFLGLSTTPIAGKLALRASTTGDVVLDDVFVPDTHVLVTPPGLLGPLGCINKARYGLAWGAFGAATACWHEVRQHALDRREFGRPLAASQLVQKKLADMQTDISIGLVAALHAGRLLDRQQLPSESIALLKRHATGKSLDIARTACGMLGADSGSDAYATMRHMCNLEALNTYEGTQDVNALILGHTQTGISAFSL
jgi:glutaryl-CoA dehydrogenase